MLVQHVITMRASSSAKDEGPPSAQENKDGMLCASAGARAGPVESTSAPWVILVINVNISLVGLILLSSIFQRVQQRRGRDKRMWNPFKMLRTNIGKSSRL